MSTAEEVRAADPRARRSRPRSTSGRRGAAHMLAPVRARAGAGAVRRSDAARVDRRHRRRRPDARSDVGGVELQPVVPAPARRRADLSSAGRGGHRAARDQRQARAEQGAAAREIPVHPGPDRDLGARRGLRLPPRRRRSPRIVGPAGSRRAAGHDPGVRGERHARRLVLPPRVPAADPHHHQGDACGGLRRVPGQLPRPRVVQRAGRYVVREQRDPRGRGLHRSAGVRVADVPPDALAAGRHRRARRAGARQGVPGDARHADRPAEPHDVPGTPATGDRPGGGGGDQPRRDDHGPRPLQGDQRHARTPLRRSAVAGDRPAGCRASCGPAT